jgi:hypothetical protein
MTIIPIYDTHGEKVDQLEIADDLEFIDGRVSKGKNSYYKGVGVNYTRQFVPSIPNDDYKILTKSDVFYVGYHVAKKCFDGKFGIFQEKFSHFYPDFIGACSIKEGLIVLNSITFPLSSVEVVDYVEFDTVNKQSYYELLYKCGRKKYVDEGNPTKLRELIDYTVKNDWNFLWDKGTIRDISADGLVTDVADMFKSDDMVHKVGSIYSVLYSLGRFNRSKYLEFIKHNGLNHIDERSFVFNVIKLLELNGIDIGPLLKYSDVNQAYRYILLNYIVNGKNCAYCACDMFTPYGEIVKNQYIEGVRKKFV